MILDSSAIVSVLLQEPGYKTILEAISNATAVGVATPTLVEAGIVLSSRLGRDATLMLIEFIRNANAHTIAFSEDHFYAAVAAFLRYGKGRHPAALDFGDCLSYAAAAVSDMPLLFTGADFSQTDIQPAFHPGTR